MERHTHVLLRSATQNDGPLNRDRLRGKSRRQWDVKDGLLRVQHRLYDIKLQDERFRVFQPHKERAATQLTQKRPFFIAVLGKDHVSIQIDFNDRAV